MEKFEIIGGKKLQGEIEVRGSKNAATPILDATLLTKQECIFANIPLIEDVFRMLEILESMGASVNWLGKRKISIQVTNINPAKMDYKKVKKLRSSILLLGALSARFDNFKMHCPGGCVIGARPVDTHFEALAKMGIKINNLGKVYDVKAKYRKPAEVVLHEFSVTATENAMLLAAGMPGKTRIKIAAAEPHVEDLGSLLIKMGAKIKGLGTHTLEITGSKNLHGVSVHKIIPDANEAATFLIMGVALSSPIKIKHALAYHLDLVLEKLREFGADFEIGNDYVKVIPAKKLKAVTKVEAGIYPGIPTDVQAPFGVLASLASGETLIKDHLFEGRFNYLSEIGKMGARSKVIDVHQAIICGPARLKGTEIKSYDLRAGASLIIAALAARGKTILNDIYQVDRGYEKIEERLKKLGANIRRIKA